MRLFICVIDTAGQGISAATQRSYESLLHSCGLDYHWRSYGPIAVLTSGDGCSSDPVTVAFGEWVAVGSVRLDNRTDLAAWSGYSGPASDLELVARVIALHGSKYISRFLGDFSFVACRVTTGMVVAACDAFAVRKLYYVRRNSTLAFASRAESLAMEDRYDLQYLAERVSLCTPSPILTVYSGVYAVPAGTMALYNGGQFMTQTYWAPDRCNVAPSLRLDDREAAATCRELLTDSLKLRLPGNDIAWAHLSGGLDSSSIVSLTQWLHNRGAAIRGLAGTITYVDRQGTDSDEREYSDAVVERWRIHNIKIIDPPFWLDGHSQPPRLDQPHGSLPYYPRERQVCAIVRNSGGHVLLTGFGGDELFIGSMFFFADWIAQGKICHAVHEMARRAAIGHTSFWELAYRNAILPLLPAFTRVALFRGQGKILPWVQQRVVDQFDLKERVGIAMAYAGRIGGKYRHSITTSVAALASRLDAGVVGDSLEVRYPFLYRPLVEFALQLPPDLTTRPQARKWVLREAMRGILPEAVRSRIGKGSSAAVLAGALAAQRSLLAPLLHEPILADLGVVDATKLRAAFDLAPSRPHRDDYLHLHLESTLILEAWLQIRSGRWPPRDHFKCVGNSGTEEYIYQPSF